MTGRRDDLLQARLDGELTSDQRVEVERLLADDDTARLRDGQLRALADTLNLLGPVDPPARVMRAVLDHAHGVAPGAGTASRTAPAGLMPPVGGLPTTVDESQMAAAGGVLMRTRVLWGLAAAAAVVLAILAIKGFPPDLGGSEGAIGAAKRYQAGQIAASDVKLGDQAAQEFLQSDLFDKLLKDANARTLLSDSHFRQLAGSAEFRNLLGSHELKAMLDANVLTDANVSAALANDALTSALSSQELAGAFANEDFLRALSEPEFRSALAGELRGLVDNAALRATLQDDAAFRGQLRKLERHSAMLKSETFLRALGSFEFRRVAFGDQFLRAFGDAQLGAALAKHEFRTMLADASLRGGLRLAGLSQALSNQNFRQLAGSGALQQGLSSDAMLQALRTNGLAAALNSPRFGEALRAGHGDR